MNEKEYINVESPPGLKARIDAYLKRGDRQYNSITQLVLSSVQKELDRLAA